MPGQHIATLKLSVNPEALRELISTGRLMEFAATAAAEAATQINAQLVQHVAHASLESERLTEAASVEVSYHSVLIDGEPGFGTQPPGPKRPTVKLEF